MPAYRLAQLANVNPNTLSKIMNHLEPVKEFDPRVVAVASILNLPVESCFEPERECVSVAAGAAHTLSGAAAK